MKKVAKEKAALPVNRLILGDAVDSMMKFPDESVDLVFTSPPYNLRNSSGNGMKDGRGGKWSNAQLLKGYASTDDAMPHVEYVEWQRKVLWECWRILKPSGAIFYNHKWRVQDGELQDRNDIVGVIRHGLRQIIIWKRKGGVNFNPGYFLPTYEVIYVFAKPDFKLAPKANALGDVWDIPQERDNPHPAPFPLELAERVIGSTKAKVVCDPFCGSGTTCVAAQNLGRAYIGIESSAEYIYMAARRLRGDKWQG